MEINSSAHVKRIEGHLIESLNYGVVNFSKVASKLEDSGVYAPLLKVGQKIWYITTKDHKKVLVESVIEEIKITREGFEYMYLKEDGNPHYCYDESVGCSVHKEYDTAVKLCEILNTVEVI